MPAENRSVLLASKTRHSLASEVGTFCCGNGLHSKQSENASTLGEGERNEWGTNSSKYASGV